MSQLYEPNSKEPTKYLLVRGKKYYTTLQGNSFSLIINKNNLWNYCSNTEVVPDNIVMSW